MVNRSQAVAILLGPIVGAMLAFGALAANDDTNVVTIDNFAFTPPELTIAVGHDGQMGQTTTTPPSRGQNYRDIAGITNVPIGTVMSRLSLVDNF